MSKRPVLEMLPADVWSKVYTHLGVRGRACMSAVSRDTYEQFNPDMKRLRALRAAARCALESRPAALLAPQLPVRCIEKCFDTIADALGAVVPYPYALSFSFDVICAVGGCAIFPIMLPAMGAVEVGRTSAQTLYRKNKDRREVKHLLRLALALECEDVSAAQTAVKRLKPNNANLSHFRWEQVAARLQKSPHLAHGLHAFIKKASPSLLKRENP